MLKTVEIPLFFLYIKIEMNHNSKQYIGELGEFET